MAVACITHDGCISYTFRASGQRHYGDGSLRGGEEKSKTSALSSQLETKLGKKNGAICPMVYEQDAAFYEPSL